MVESTSYMFLFQKQLLGTAVQHAYYKVQISKTGRADRRLIPGAFKCNPKIYPSALVDPA